MVSIRPTSVRARAGHIFSESESMGVLTGGCIHAGTDHQRIAKLDRENEVAPPPKIAPSVGKVCHPIVPVCADC